MIVDIEHPIPRKMFWPNATPAPAHWDVGRFNPADDPSKAFAVWRAATSILRAKGRVQDDGETHWSGHDQTGYAHRYDPLYALMLYPFPPSNSVWLLRVFGRWAPDTNHGHEVMRLAWNEAVAEPSESGGLFVERYEPGGWEAQLARVAADVAEGVGK